MSSNRLGSRHRLVAGVALVAVLLLGMRIFVAPSGHEGLLVHVGFILSVGVLLAEMLRFMVYLFDPIDRRRF